MNFNRHSNFEGQHAFLGPSKYAWLNYDEQKMAEAYARFMSIQRGTELHDLARRLISLGVRLPKSNHTLNMYVNDALSYHMRPEQILFYSPNCFGTADAICFRKNLLRIHDLKTGVTPASMHQLEIYTALFCLEYGYKPDRIDIELRIYQSDDVEIHQPEAMDISAIMDKIVTFDKVIERLKTEEE